MSCWTITITLQGVANPPEFDSEVRLGDVLKILNAMLAEWPQVRWLVDRLPFAFRQHEGGKGAVAVIAGTMKNIEPDAVAEFLTQFTHKTGGVGTAICLDDDVVEETVAMVAAGGEVSYLHP